MSYMMTCRNCGAVFSASRVARVNCPDCVGKKGRKAAPKVESNPAPTTGAEAPKEAIVEKTHLTLFCGADVVHSVTTTTPHRTIVKAMEHYKVDRIVVEAGGKYYVCTTVKGRKAYHRAFIGDRIAAMKVHPWVDEYYSGSTPSPLQYGSQR